MSPYLAKDPRPDLSQGMSLKAVEEIEARAQEAQKYALEAESLSQQAQQASQEALAAIERKDRETVTEKCKEAERLAAEAKEVEEARPPTTRARRRARTRAPWPTRATPRSPLSPLFVPPRFKRVVSRHPPPQRHQRDAAMSRRRTGPPRRF